MSGTPGTGTGSGPVPVIDPGPDWQVEAETRSTTAVRRQVHRAGVSIDVALERAVAGSFRDAFPAGEHDLLVQVRPCDDLDAVGDLLATHASAFAPADPACRRLVLAAPEGRLEVIDVAERAGYRYVADVETAAGGFSLLVVEPGWVTSVDMDLDRVPQT